MLHMEKKTPPVVGTGGVVSAAFELALAYVAPGERRRRRRRLRRNTATEPEWPLEQSTLRRLSFGVPIVREVIRSTGYMGQMDKSTLSKPPDRPEHLGPCPARPRSESYKCLP